MSLRSLLLLVVGLCVVVFVGVNWGEISRPTEVQLIFGSIQAPLGLVLLVIMAVLVALFVGVIAYTQSATLMQTHRHTKELAAQRELADKAEVSRITELRAHLEAELAKLADTIRQQGQEAMARVDRAEMGLRERPVDERIGQLVQAVQEHNRELHARLDRLEMGLGQRLDHPAPPPAPQADSVPPAPEGKT
jgi:Skp family chaperone for outer membrane proteins